MERERLEADQTKNANSRTERQIAGIMAADCRERHIALYGPSS